MNKYILAGLPALALLIAGWLYGFSILAPAALNESLPLWERVLSGALCGAPLLFCYGYRIE